MTNRASRRQSSRCNSNSDKEFENIALRFVDESTEDNFNALARLATPRLRGFVYGIAKESDVVDDIVNRTLENIYYKHDQYNPANGKFSTWMFKIAMNNTLKYISGEFPDAVYTSKQNKLFSQDISQFYDSSLMKEFDASVGDTPCVEMPDFDGPDREKIFCDAYDASLRCINELPEEISFVMKERYIKNKKVKEISDENMISVPSVKNWLVRGRAMVYEELVEKYPDLCFDLITKVDY